VVSNHFSGRKPLKIFQCSEKNNILICTVTRGPFEPISYSRFQLTLKSETFMSAGVNFINILGTAFALVDPKSVKNTVKSSVSFYAFEIY